MKQKLNDLKLMVQNDKKWLFLGAFLLVCVVLVVLSESGGGRSRRRPGPIEDKPSAQGMGAEETYKDLIESFKNDIESQKTKQEELIAVIRRNNADFSEHKKEVSGVIETLVDRYENLAREMESVVAASQNKPEQPIYPQGRQNSIESSAGFERLGEDPPAIPPPPPLPKPTRISVISPGDSVDVQLLTGVNAPVDGTPYPVVFKLNSAITGPDGSSLPLGESRLVAAAQGSEVDSRALFRLSSLSIRHPSGRRSVVKVDGWVVGEDGIRGMNGKLIDKLGRLILATAGVSFAAALGDRIGGSNTRDSRSEPGLRANSTDFDVAAASALTDSSNRLGKLLLDRYESFVPVVEVLANRDAVAIFSQSAEISILDDDGDFEGGVFAAGFED